MGGSNKTCSLLDLLQGDLTSFLASGASFLGCEAATNSREVPRILR